KTWKQYTFKLDKKTWTADALAARHFARARDLAKIGKPFDRDDWQMTVPTVNAYYDPQINGMVFPAGILQPPFYSVDASIPVNLGGMGIVVGHELTHGFDDQGAQYDAFGNLVNWWQPATEQQFKLGFGQAWCAKVRPDFEKLIATVDVHSPARWRVNGALSATPDFGKAF